MRYAVFSDIHANLQAWNALLIDSRSMAVDRLICLGDIVGYGPNPRQVLESVHASAHHIVMGNHDAALCGVLDVSLFNDTARESIDWTRRQLNARALAFLRSLPLCLTGPQFRCAHADFANPASFDYTITPAEALRSWQTVPEPMLFIGHTHEPAIFVIGSSGRPHRIAPQDFEAEDGKRFIVNVGSVGQPRDGDTRAAYCIYDSVKRAVHFRRIPFDLDAFRGAVGQAGISAAASAFTRHDPRTAATPIRERVDFTPPRDPAQGARNVIEVQSIEVLQTRVRRWRTLSVVSLLTTLALALAAGALGFRHATRSALVGAPRIEPIEAAAAAEGADILAPLAAATEPNAAVPGWRLKIGNRHKQDVRVAALDGGALGFVMRSGTLRDECRIVCGPIRVAPEMKLQFSGLVRKSPDFRGDIALAVPLTRAAGAAERHMDQFEVKQPNQQKGDWLLAQKTITLPAQSESIAFEIRGRFTGTVEVKDLALVRK